MGEEIKSEETEGEDVESRLSSLKKSLMKMFTRESELEGATSPTAGTTATENEGAEENGAEEGSPAKVSSLKKRLSFKAMRSKFSKEKKEEHVKMGEEEEREIATDETKEKLEASAKVNQDESEAEVDEEPTSPTEAVSVLPGELKQSFADAVKQPEKVAQALSGSEAGETELETESRTDS